VALSGLPAEGSGDPQVAFAADGSVVASALGLFPGERDSAGRRMSVQVFRSRDDGLHWVKAAVFGAGAFTDHPQMIVGPAPARNDVVVSALYWADATARTTHLGLFRSRDAARTFLPPIEVATDSLRRLFNLEPLLFSDGSVFVPYARFGFGPPSACPSFEVDAMVVDRRFTSHGRQLVVRRGISDPNGCGGGLPYAKVTFAIHHGPRGDRLFALMNEELEGRYRLTLSHSDDRGATWSTPAAIAPSTEEQFRPAIFVDRGGTVGVSWCQADAAGPPRDFAQYFAASLDDGDTFGPPVRVSSAPSPIRAHGNDVVLHSIITPTFDSATASIAFTMFMASGATDAGEYTGLTGDGRGVFHPFWVDSRNGINQLWSASVYTRGAPAARLNPPARVATGRVELVFDPGRWDSAASVMIVPLRLRNRSTTPLCAPLAIEIVDTTTVPHPTILNASNRLEWAGARIDYTQALGDLTCLEPGHATDPIALRVRPLPARVPVQRPSLTMRVRVVGSSAP
jgi:hypothetical protein